MTSAEAGVHLRLIDSEHADSSDVRIDVKGLDQSCVAAPLAGLRRAGAKSWVAGIQNVPQVLRALRSAGVPVTLAEPLVTVLKNLEASSWLDLQAVEGRLAVVEKELALEGEKLREYQRAGARWLAARLQGALLADEMGLGKTLQTLASLPAHAPVLVVCPAKVKGVWVKQVRKWRPALKTVVVEGMGGFRFPVSDEVVIVNYDILPETHKEACPLVWEKRCPGCSPYYPGAHRPGCDRFRKVCPGCSDLPTPDKGTFMVLDEAHYIKSPDALRSQSCRALGQRVVDAGGRRIALTGTPLMNRPDELWNLLDAVGLAGEAFGTWGEFRRLFSAKPKEVWTTDRRTGKKRKQLRGTEWGEPLPEAPERLARVMLRRRQEDVLSDLPDRTYKIIPVHVDRKKLKVCDELLEHVERMGGAKALGELLSKKRLPFELVSAARAALCAAKVDAALDVVEEYENEGKPLVVFSAHRAPAEVLADREGWKAILGDMKESASDVVDWFQESDDVRGLACTIGAAGTGITLTRASHMLFVDQAWNPAQNDQAEARCRRLGQKNALLVNILVADHPLDERVTELLTEKRSLFRTVVDGAAVKESEA